MKELGQPRGVGFVIIMSIVTLGIYSIYWTYKTYSELKRYRGQGVGGVAGILLGIIVVGLFLLPSYVGRLYKEDLIEKGEDPVSAANKVPITGWSGLFVLIPYVGGIVWFAKVQGKLNNFWEGQALRSEGAPAAAPAGEPA